MHQQFSNHIYLILRNLPRRVFSYPIEWMLALLIKCLMGENGIRVFQKGILHPPIARVGTSVRCSSFHFYGGVIWHQLFISLWQNVFTFQELFSCSEEQLERLYRPFGEIVNIKTSRVL